MVDSFLRCLKVNEVIRGKNWEGGNCCLGNCRTWGRQYITCRKQSEIQSSTRVTPKCNFRTLQIYQCRLNAWSKSWQLSENEFQFVSWLYQTERTTVENWVHACARVCVWGEGGMLWHRWDKSKLRSLSPSCHLANMRSRDFLIVRFVTKGLASGWDGMGNYVTGDIMCS